MTDDLHDMQELLSILAKTTPEEVRSIIEFVNTRRAENKLQPEYLQTISLDDLFSDKPIRGTRLRAYNALVQEDVRNLLDLCAKTDAHIKRIPQVGRKVFECIKSILDDRNITDEIRDLAYDFKFKRWPYQPFDAQRQQANGRAR